MIGTTALLSGFSLLGLPGAALLDQGRAVALGWANLLLAAVGLVHSLALLWSESERGWKLLVATVAFAGAAAQASGTTARRRDNDPLSVNLLYVVGIAGGILLAALITIAAWQEVDDEAYYRVVGALAVAEVLVVVLQPILRRTTKSGAGPSGARFVCTLDDGRELDCTDAVAAAISKLEREGAKVLRIERSR